jgi:16S rRNA (uracil1498-N3)-methyltransferase
MRRFFLGADIVIKGTVAIKGAQAHHIKNVIRLKPGDAFIGLDGKGNAYKMSVVDTKGSVTARVDSLWQDRPMLQRVLLACALPKKHKMDSIVEKATELGVSDIIPMVTERTIVRPASAPASKMRARWQKISEEASEQSGRLKPAVIHDIVSLEKAVCRSEALGYGHRIIPVAVKGLDYITVRLPVDNISTAVFIGPEGDFSLKEIRIAKEHGLQPVSLGRFVLKVDTACYFVLSLLSAAAYEGKKNIVSP